MEEQSQEQTNEQQNRHGAVHAGVFMSDPSQRGSKKEQSLQLIVGVMLAVLGVAFLFNNFGVIEMGNVWRYWPLILVAIGLNKTLQEENPRRRGSGLWWMFWGFWLLVSELHLFGLSFRTSWPLIIIAWGIHILWKSSTRNSRNYFAKEQHNGN